MGGGLISCICVSEKDRKKLIAYSSVAHMAFVIFGYLRKSSRGITAALLFMYAHGVCSSGLFIGSYVIYTIRGRRSFYLNFGLLRTIPMFGILWAYICLRGMGLPPTSNFFREILCIIRMFNRTKTFFLPVSTLCFLAAAYSLVLYSNSIHGQTKLSYFIGIDNHWYLRLITLVVWRWLILFII